MDTGRRQRRQLNPGPGDRPVLERPETLQDAGRHQLRARPLVEALSTSAHARIYAAPRALRLKAKTYSFEGFMERGVPYRDARRETFNTLRRDRMRTRRLPGCPATVLHGCQARGCWSKGPSVRLWSDHHLQALIRSESSSACLLFIAWYGGTKWGLNNSAF